MKSQLIYYIHGFRYNQDRQPDKTERCQDTFDKLSNALHQRLNYTAVYFDYPTGLLKRTGSFSESAKRLENKILDDYYVYKNYCKNNSANFEDFKIAIIAHSAGGLVARKALVNMEAFSSIDDDDSFSNVLPYIRHISLLASPSQGITVEKLTGQLVQFCKLDQSTLQNLKRIFDENGNLLNINLNELVTKLNISAQIIELIKPSKFLIELNRDWIEWTKKYSKCTVRCMYGSEDQLVVKEDTDFLDTNTVIINGLNHGEIKHVNNLNQPEDDEIYKNLYKFLTDAGFK